MKLFSKLAVAVCLTAATVTAFADTYPSKPIRLVVPFPPGGTTDLLARIYATRLGTDLKTPVVVDNRPGAGGSIGADAVAKASADGYTLLFGTLGTQAINPALYKKLPYDTTNDFTPIALFADVPNILVVNSKVPVRTVKEFVDYSKKNPGALNMGSSGNGSSNHLSGELFKSMTGADFTHVPYKGGAPATQDLLAGQIQLIFENLPSALPHIKTGREIPIAVTTAKRSPLLPDVPTVAESGINGYEAGVWFGVLGPREMPADIVDRLAKSMNAMTQDKAFVEKVAQTGGTLVQSTPASFAELIRTDTVKWAKVVKESGATID